jgi:hypothetical protein
MEKAPSRLSLRTLQLIEGARVREDPARGARMAICNRSLACRAGRALSSTFWTRHGHLCQMTAPFSQYHSTLLSVNGNGAPTHFT